MYNGWIRLHRILLEKPIWFQSTPEQKTILITLLLKANHAKKDWEWCGQKYSLKPGQMITSLQEISKLAGKGISIQNVRTALIRFEKYGLITNESTNQNRLITIVNWDLYQTNDNRSTIKLTGNSQSSHSRLTSNKNNKNGKECKNKYPLKHIEHHEVIPEWMNKSNSHESIDDEKVKKRAEWLEDYLSNI